ncbi:alginate export family protein [Asticcacaulis sp. DW145]|uniref:alginate export family protein n=1 Tax=Asticcacaulis sp. DW145 TaxID=3095608 RepID=UPI003086BDDB|nr:alginate export family protein [Asticcacaulis sp. DW145]
MKTYLFTTASVAGLSLCTFAAQAQTLPDTAIAVNTSPARLAAPAEPVPGGRAGAPKAFQTHRWAEDWTAEPEDNAPFTQRVKHIRLGQSGAYLTLGGEARVYYTDWTHSLLGLRNADANTPTQTRLRLSADLHANPYLRAYVELGDNRETGETAATVPNQDKLDIYQAFVDVTLPLSGSQRLTLRPGRFEMPLGNGKLVGVREGLNMRYTYQGAQLTYSLTGQASVTLFDVYPVDIQKGTFDDAVNRNTHFRGGYISLPKAAYGLNLDLYGYDVNRARGTLFEGTGPDERKSLGARVWQKSSQWDVDVEMVRQSGTFITKSVEAYAVMFEAGYRWPDTKYEPRLGLRLNAFSGDDKSGDNQSGTFVAPAPRLPLISEAGFFNLSNLIDAYPSLTLKPMKALTLTLGPDFLWRQNAADGVYIGSSGASFAPYGEDRFIGTDLNLEATWQVNKNLQIKLYETRFIAGDAFKASGGKDGNYFGLMTGYRF